jgi:hypothetical protein
MSIQIGSLPAICCRICGKEKQNFIRRSISQYASGLWFCSDACLLKGGFSDFCLNLIKNGSMNHLLGEG